VVSKFGEAAWLKILALSRAAPAGGGEFIAMQAYDDKGLYDVVAAACKVLYQSFTTFPHFPPSFWFTFFFLLACSTSFGR
jgi:hypothetical protein